MNEAGNQTQTAKPKKKFGIRFKAKKSKKTDGSLSEPNGFYCPEPIARLKICSLRSWRYCVLVE